MEQPVILCGYGRVGRRVLDYLRAADVTVTVIDRRVDPADPHLAGVRVINGDFRHRAVLEDAGAACAAGVLVVTSNDMVNISTALMIRAIAPELRIVLRVFNENLICRLATAIPNVFPLSTSALTAPLLAAKAVTGQALGLIRLGEERLQVVQMTISADSPLVGKTIGHLETSSKVRVLARIPAADKRLEIAVEATTPLRPGDELALCGDPTTLNLILTHGKAPTPELLWASFLRRNARAAWRTLREVDTSVKVSTGVLITVVLLSVLYFHIVAQQYNRHELEGANSFSRTVSLIATSASMQTQDDDPPELKIFVGFLRLGGAALTAAFTAILTNYLVRASLRGALEVRRIPDGGHVVLVGLGSIGYRTVDELLRLGQRVVVVETNRENRFISTVRGRGVPVIVGDASVGDVLQQANSRTARAVVVSTGDDLANLEISLLCRELNPHQRVVLLQTDQHLAHLLREAAHIRLAVSVPALAAPAFVAGLFGDRVQSMIMLHDQLLAVVDLKVANGDPHLDGQAVRALAIDWRLLPVAVIPGDGRPQARNPLTARLTPGDRLVALMHVSDLEALLLRRPPAAEWAVDIHVATRSEWLQLLVGSALHLDAEEAAQALEQLPLRLKSRLTRGQAEDLLAMLRREQVEARLEHLPEGQAHPRSP